VPATKVVRPGSDEIELERPLTVHSGTPLPLMEHQRHEATRNPAWDRDRRRWEQFETEFGLGEPSISPFLARLESAKYRLDKTVFAVDDLVESVENAFEFEYRFRSGRWHGRSDARATASAVRTTHGPAWDMLQDARLRSDIDIDVFKSEAFIGLRLIIPIGD
jgi:hypothetical protein